jgi:hypothetical protein
MKGGRRILTHMNWGWLLFGVAFGIAIPALLVLSQYFWHRSVWRLTARVSRSWIRTALRLLWFGTFAVVFLLVADEARLHPRRLLHTRNTLTALFVVWFASALFAYLGVQTIRGLDRVWGWARRAVTLGRAEAPPGEQENALVLRDPSRRYLFQTATRVVGAAPFLCAVYGYAAERLNYQVRQVQIPLPNLPAELEGLRIVQLSDIHRSIYMPRQGVRRAVDMANQLAGDLAVVTGDFITVSGDLLDECIGELARLRAPLGVWGCNGNHEIYARVEAAAQRLFAREGMRLLRQECAQLTWRGAQFNLIGVDYQRQRTPEGRKIPTLVDVERLVRRDRPNILLSHNPNSFPRAAELGIELSLAGHTHGGQVQVEILDHRLSPARFITDYVAGHYQRPMFASEDAADDDDSPGASDGHLPMSSIYVNRGLGTVAAPIRLGVPPEITLIVLKPA